MTTLDEVFEERSKERTFYYKKKYGLDEKLATVLSDAKNRIGNCPICRKQAQLVLDHDHMTGLTRDMICGACNSMLGYSGESLDALYGAIAYLKKHKGV